MEKNNYLLDTHIFIWAMEESKQLPKHIRKEIIDPQNKIYLSVAALWEIVIKTTTKQMKLNFDPEESIKKAGFEMVSIQASHVLSLSKLPLHHKDPFDRILISQAKAENLTLITSDKKMWQYDISLLKA